MNEVIRAHTEMIMRRDKWAERSEETKKKKADRYILASMYIRLHHLFGFSLLEEPVRKRCQLYLRCIQSITVRPLTAHNQESHRRHKHNKFHGSLAAMIVHSSGGQMSN
uniref:Uncharacterized protein n=1 Tax=Caenorhabditis japonica TaxID=281687 RepID=A0A8R1IRM3_CAEJA